VAGGFQYRTRRALAGVIRASGTVAPPPVELSALEQLVPTAIAYFQPITRMGCCRYPRQAGQPRCDRGAAQLRLDRDRPAQPAAGRALHLRDNAGVPRTWRTAEPA
jgi:hypothetical protein